MLLLSMEFLFNRENFPLKCSARKHTRTKGKLLRNSCSARVFSLRKTLFKLRRDAEGEAISPNKCPEGNCLVSGCGNVYTSLQLNSKVTEE